MSSIPLFFTAERNPIVPSPGKRLGCERISIFPQLAQVTPASRLAVQPAPEMVPSGVRELDALTGGWPRGCLSEICGAASSGRTSVLLAALGAATERQEACALVDAGDVLDPASAATAGVNFERLLWVRCDACPKNPPLRHQNTEGKNITSNSQMMYAVEQALRVTDLLLQSGGFGLVVIDLGSVPYRTARRIPLTSWFRFQRAVEHTPTVLLLVTLAPCAQTCATVLLKLSAIGCQLSAEECDHARKDPAHAQLLGKLSIEAELLRSRLRKPVRSVTTAFETKTLCAG